MMEPDEHTPLGTIQDSPKYRHRGLLLDCSRHFFPVEIIEKVIEQMSLVKLNVFHWHLTDDQGWRIESREFPKLHQMSKAYYSQEEICHVVEYARDRGITVIPEIDLPGHSASLLTAYPELGCPGNTVPAGQDTTVFQNVLCAGKDTVFSFLDKLLAEVCQLFPADFVHVGGDEVSKEAWRKCPCCAKKMESQGIENYDDLQVFFTNRLDAILKKHGKRIICWNDSLEADNLTKDALIQYWTDKHSASMYKYEETGVKFLYSWKFHLYFDYPYRITPLKTVYEFSPQIEEGHPVNPDQLTGFEACLWTEGVADLQKLGELVFPRAYAMAENAWSQEKNYEDFQSRLGKILSLSRQNGIPYNAEENWDMAE